MWPTPVVDAVIRVVYVLAYRVAYLYWFLFRPRAEGINVFIWHGNRLLVVEHSYKRRLSAPGGFMKSGEQPAMAAAREVREEVGIDLEPQELHYLGARVAVEDYKRERLHLFECRLSQAPTVTVDNREVVRAAFLRPQAALSLPLSPPMREYLAGGLRVAE